MEGAFPSGFLVAHRLNRKGHRAQTARGFDKEEASDGEQLVFAAQNNLAMVTHNHNHFLVLHDAWRS